MNKVSKVLKPLKKFFNNLKKIILKHKVLFIIFSFLFLVTLIVYILFLIKGYDFINYRTINYNRTNICVESEYDKQYRLNLNLYQILNTTEYSEKIYIINNYNIKNITMKSYKNSPAKEGKVNMNISDCNKGILNFVGRYKIVNGYVIIYNDYDIYIFYYDKKHKSLVDYYNYTNNNSNETYKIVK